MRVLRFDLDMPTLLSPQTWTKKSTSIIVKISIMYMWQNTNHFKLAYIDTCPLELMNTEQQEQS